MLSYSLLIVTVAKEKCYLFSFSNNKPSSIFIPDIISLENVLHWIFSSVLIQKLDRKGDKNVTTYLRANRDQLNLTNPLEWHRTFLHPA